MTKTERARHAGRVGHLLLYGTLRADQPAYRTHGLDLALTRLGPRSIGGALYDLGAYPGLVLEGNGTVAAELHRIDRPSVLGRLDRFEGYEPGRPRRSLFLRKKITVELDEATGALADVWVYVYNGPLSNAKRVIGGSWPAYVAWRRHGPVGESR